MSNPAAHEPDLSSDQPRILDRSISGSIAWKADTLLPDDGSLRIDPACLDELRSAATLLRANPLPLEALTPDDFALPACRALMTRTKTALDEGVGFAILDRLPLDELDTEEARALYWLLLSMLGPIVAQKWDGLMIYDVTDTGRESAPGRGVRGSKTNAGQGYHTDNSYNLPPSYVSLLCLNPAKEGGVSGLVSFYAVHNILLERYPDLLPRLYRPFYFDRHREHASNDNPVSYKPAFTYDGRTLSVSLSTNQIRSGYKMMGETMDDETAAAVDALDRVLEEPGLGKSFVFERGQIQIANNRTLGHRRTAFTDWPDEERKRHLVRIWVRNQGRRFYAG
jgi:alpha-ketoglutarate-dependent taurine dioxygenase